MLKLPPHNGIQSVTSNGYDGKAQDKGNNITACRSFVDKADRCHHEGRHADMVLALATGEIVVRGGCLNKVPS